MKTSPRTMVRIICFGAILLFCSSVIPLHETGPNDSFVLTREETRWEPAYTITNTVEIPPGGYHYVDFIGDNYLVHPQEEVDKYAALGKLNGGSEIIEAVDSCPEWMKDDLIEALVNMGQRDIDSVENPWGVSFGDVDKDNDLDLVVGGTNEIIYFENAGTLDEPLFVRSEIDLPPPPEPFINNYVDLADLDADGDLDIVLGEFYGDIHVYWNEGWPGAGGFTLFPSLVPNVADGSSAPALGDLDNDGDLDMICGSESNGIYYIPNLGTAQVPYFPIDSRIKLNLQTNDFTKPVLADLDSDSDLDLLVGDSDGDISYFENQGTINAPVWGPNNPAEFTGMADGADVQAVPVDLYNDGLLDLVQINPWDIDRFYKNYGDLYNPNYVVWSTYEVTAGLNYYPRWDPFTILEGHSPLYYSRIINDASTEINDEVIFSIAHTAREDLWAVQNRDMGEVFLDNAEYLYINDDLIKYAEIIDIGDLSTIRYSYRDETGIVDLTLPKEIYYWYVVHPNISNQGIGYVDPQTGNFLPKDQGGRFWREYLVWHSDEQYPTDPGNGVLYPRAVPPLLSDEISTPTVVYDGVAYSAPQGFLNNGTGNRREFGYKDHAIDAISNWVAKTLPLNEQESADGERPLQPVRIATHHNGNCGELHDLTVSAARSCLIPTTGASMPGEDHTWSQFWLNGWHQWDNYWSDGGADIDNWFTYWSGWGGSRTGSGVYREEPHGGITDTASDYIPRDHQSTVTVQVLDRDGYPVDGARVLLLSHWLLDFGDDPDITAPFPNIYKYTDMDGLCTFTCANRDISLKITSKLGNDALQKTTIGAGESHFFSFDLEGVKPDPEVYQFEDPALDTLPEADSKYMVVDYEVLGSVQYPPDALSGNVHPQEFDNGSIDAMVLPWNSFNEYKSGPDGSMHSALRADLDTRKGTFNFILPGYDGHIVFGNKRSLETHQIVRYTIKAYDRAPSPELIPGISYPHDGSVLEAGVSTEIGGYVMKMRNEELTGLVLEVEGEEHTIFPRPESSWCWSWSYDLDWVDLPQGLISYTVTLRASGNGVSVYSDSVTYELVDTTNGYLWASEPADRGTFTLGEPLNVSGTINDNNRIRSVRLFIDDEFHQDLTGGLVWDGANTDSRYSALVDTAELTEGWHNFLFIAIDRAGFECKHKVRYRFENLAPVVSIDTPVNGTVHLIGPELEITGQAYDDSGLSELVLYIDGPDFEIQEELDVQQDPSYLLPTAAREPGRYNISLKAVDRYSKEAHAYGYFDLEFPPDVERPVVKISYPLDDSTFVPGEEIEIEGVAYDNEGIGTLMVRIDGPEGLVMQEDISEQVTSGSNQWVVEWLTINAPEGTYKITLSCWDTQDNFNSTYVNVELDLPDKEDDRRPPSVSILQPAPQALLTQDSSVLFKGTATDDTGVLRVSISFDGGLTFVRTDLSGDSWEYYWGVAPDEDPGDVVVVVEAEDLVGKTAEDSVIVSVVDPSPPEVDMQLVGPFTVQAGADVTVILTLSDNTGVDRAEIQLTGQPYERVPLASGETYQIIEYTLNIPYDMEGPVELSSVVYDGAGNKGEASLALTVEQPVDETEEKDDESEDSSGFSVMWLIYLVGVVVLVVIFVVLAVRNRRR